MKLENRSRQISDDVRARQRNTIWPDTLRNETTLLGFLWNGCPTATGIQRAGIAVISLIFFLVPSLGLLYVAALKAETRSPLVPVLVSAPVLAIGCKLLLSAFRH